MKKLGRKGFTISPFFLIALVLIGVLLTTHFRETDETKQKQIQDQGEENRNALAVEQEAESLQSLLLLVSYQAVYEENKKISDDLTAALGKNIPVKDALAAITDDAIKKDLEEMIKKDFDRESGSNFAVKVDNSKPDEGFIVTASGEIDSNSDGKVPVTLEKFVNARIFLLNDKLDSIEADFKTELLKQMKCRFSGSSSSTKNNCIESTDPKTGKPRIECTIESISGNTVPGEILAGSLKNPEEARRRLIVAVDEIQRTIAVDSSKNKDDTLTVYAIQSIGTGVAQASFIPFKDPKAASNINNKLYCCHSTTVKAVKDKNGKIIKEAYSYCDTPDYDYDSTVDIEGVIKIDAKVYDHAKIGDDAGGNYKICSTSPIMTNTGRIVPLELGYVFEIPVVVHVKYKAECKTEQFRGGQTGKTTTYPVYSIDSGGPIFTVDPVKCSSGIKGPGKVCEDTLVRENPVCSCGN